MHKPYIFLQIKRLWKYYVSRNDCDTWHHQMETFSALLALFVWNSAVTGEFPSQRPVSRSFDVFFDLYQTKQLSKQPRRWWFVTPSRSLWRHCHDFCLFQTPCCKERLEFPLVAFFSQPIMDHWNYPFIAAVFVLCFITGENLWRHISPMASEHLVRDKMSPVLQTTFCNAFLQWRIWWISIKKLLELVTRGLIDKMSAYVQIMDLLPDT